jgi:hypothetical protein
LAATAQVKSGGFSDWKRSREEPGYYLYSGRESARCKHNHHHRLHRVCRYQEEAAGCERGPEGMRCLDRRLLWGHVAALAQLRLLISWQLLGSFRPGYAPVEERGAGGVVGLEEAAQVAQVAGRGQPREQVVENCDGCNAGRDGLLGGVARGEGAQDGQHPGHKVGGVEPRGRVGGGGVEVGCDLAEVLGYVCTASFVQCFQNLQAVKQAA